MAKVKIPNYTYQKRSFDMYLDENERIYYIGRKNLIILANELIKVFFLFGFLPYVVAIIAFQLTSSNLIYLFIGFCVLWGLLRSMRRIIIWYFDAWLITSLGIIDIEWRGIFNRISTRIDYQTIEGVTYEINGLIPTMFNYGDIIVDRIGNGSPVCLTKARDPKKLELMILKCQYIYKRRRSFQESSALKDVLSAIKNQSNPSN